MLSKSDLREFMTTALAAQRPCDLFAMSKELLYQVFIMTQCPNAATIVSMGVADIKAPTSLPIMLINHQQHNWQDQKVYTRYLWLFWLVSENCRQEDDERLRCWSTSAMKNKDISLKKYNLYSSKGRSSSNGISKKLSIYMMLIPPRVNSAADISCRELLEQCVLSHTFLSYYLRTLRVTSCLDQN